MHNKAYAGGAISVYDIPLSSTVSIQNNVFFGNFAFKGGAIHYGYAMLGLEVQQNIFLNNSASMFGLTFSTEANKVIWTKPLPPFFGIYSGDILPPYAVTLVDRFDGVVAAIEWSSDAFVANVSITLPNGSIGNAVIDKSFQKPLLNHEEEVLFEASVLYGLPGEYSLVISPIGRTNEPRFTLKANVTVLPCNRPRVESTYMTGAYKSCVYRK
jgi:hypothetical protein